MSRSLQCVSTLAVASFLFLSGCGEEAPATQSSASPAAKSGYITGRVTTADGKPITTDGAKISVTISGISSKSAENVSFSPAVKPDGSYSQKVPDGSYQVRFGKISVPHSGFEFTFDLEPQGDEYANDRDSADGIKQDFVWRVTGPTLMYARGKLDPNNHTHWNGQSLGMRFATYREDLKSGPPVVPPAGTKLHFTLTPVPGKKAIDGSELKIVTFERDWQPTKITPNDDLNDFLPGEYTITGEAKFPDGTTKPIVFQGKDDYPNYVNPGKVPFEQGSLVSSIFKLNMTWGIN